MSKLPTDWLHRIFELMNDFYGERWSNNLKDHQVLMIYQEIWFNSLRYLSYEQIKNGLKKAKYLSQIRVANPPNHIEFYHLCVDIVYIKTAKKYNLVPRRTYGKKNEQKYY